MYFDNAPPEARSLRELPLLILVGLTGTGKSSLLRALGYPTLPERRALVDRYIVPRYGAQLPLERSQRFALTRRFREEHPGGVAEVLAQGKTNPIWPLLFDGLRGGSEVAYALEHLPHARFVVLEAHPALRLHRLIGRQEDFDRERPGEEPLEELASGILDPDELAQLLGRCSEEELRAKLRIVREEGRSYDPQKVRTLLEASPRALFLDTGRLSLEEEVARIREWIDA